MKILMVLTSRDQLGNTGQKTGFWLEEFASPFLSLQGCEGGNYARVCQGRPGYRGGYNGHQVINADDTSCQRDIARSEQTGRSASRDGRDKTSNPTVDSKSSRSMGL